MTTLVFEKNSMLETTILCNSVPAYTVSTRWPASLTDIRVAGTDALVAQINPKTLLPDTVLFADAYDGKELRVSKWLRHAKLRDGSTAHVLSLGGERQLLTAHEKYGLSLRALETGSILAHWRPEMNSSPLALVISPDIEKYETEILAAFLFEEGRIRASDAQNTKPNVNAMVFTSSTMGVGVGQM
ncbi:hypothetical protein MVEN_01724900 [Mycena venus]|uniref:Uncharacterized protein n=1 Tax=Mycena venus TaxID=2733690 RepID=A0A8H6XM68_9AGAR|nr:hypothetical protein MVEN_01724900 [Mycena venus]